MKVVGAPYWHDKPVVLIGGGASLNGFDFKRLEGLDVYLVGVKHSMFHLRCHAGMAADRQLCMNQWGKLLEQKLRGTELYLMPNDREEKHFAPLVQMKRNADRIGLSDDPEIINTGGNSGFAALNVAYLKKVLGNPNFGSFGVSRKNAVRGADPHIILLGYDHDPMGLHYHDQSLQESSPREYWQQRANAYFATIPRLQLAGIRVINASPQSRVDAFTRCSIEEAMEWLESHYAIAA